MKLPVVKNNQSSYPLKSPCPWCRKNKVLEPHPFVTIGGGACLMDRQTSCGGPDNNMDGFLYFACHDHDDNSNRPRWVEIARDVRGGQFDLYFCSTKCLREFLNYCVDELEKQ